MNKLLPIFVLLLLAGCKDRYDLVLKPSDTSLLVVEGALDAGNGPTTIRLSKTLKVNESLAFSPELNARVTVEGQDGSSYTLSPSGLGRYFNSHLGLTTGQEYRLRIKTADNKEYLSDFVRALPTPAIDSVNWHKTEDGLMVYVNTHDPAQSSRYYKWDFDETWEIRSYYASDFEYVGGTEIVYHPMYRFRCWKYGISQTINIGSSAKLAEDKINEAPVLLIPFGSEKLSVRYSMLLKQQALTKQAYEYFQLMKKNTETLGTIFDPQPSELKGNIHCVTNPAEGVIGYLTAAEFTQKRIFITAQDLNWSYQQACYYERVKNNPDSIRAWVPSYLPFGGEEIAPGVVTYYYMAPAACVDCTKRGGDLNMPSYW
ncbi:MAG: DUF4249 domain-containing protein [Flavisolibacter sp.]